MTFSIALSGKQQQQQDMLMHVDLQQQCKAGKGGKRGRGNAESEGTVCRVTSAINAFSFWLSTKKLNYKAKILVQLLLLLQVVEQFEQEMFSQPVNGQQRERERERVK